MGRERKLEIEEILRMEKAFVGAFDRRITNTWINPAKSRGYFEDMRRIFFKDESPEGLYPACVVTKDLLGKIVIVIPQDILVETLKKLEVEKHYKRSRFARILMGLAEMKPTGKDKGQTNLSDFKEFKKITESLAKDQEKVRELYGESQRENEG